MRNAGAADRSGPGASGWTGSGRDSPVGVLAALPEEVDPVRDRLEGARTYERPTAGTGRSLVISRGRLGETTVAVAVTGVGRGNARTGAREFLRSVSVDRLLVLGVGGALSPDLEPCSLLLGRRIWLGAGRRLAPGGEALEWARRRTGATPGEVVTVNELLHSPRKKRAVWSRVRDAEPASGPAIADLESGHYADVAEREGVDWLVLRGVSDDASEALPAYLADCRDETGAVRRGAVAGRAVLHPSTIPQLVRLRKRVARCARAMAEGVDRMMTAEAA